MHYGRAGAGPSVLLIHGIPTSSYLWRNVAPRLVAAGREVITIDMLGYGASDKPVDADLGIAAQARLISRVLSQIEWQGGTVVGHDIGGGVAQLLAVDNRERVRNLIIVDSIAYDSFPEPGIARLKDAAWDGILGATDFDVVRGLTKGFSRTVAPTA
jgi:pimeloyl-ACP methyl ester carboxylesterase